MSDTQREALPVDQSVESLMESLDIAWGLIANANEGDWDKATPEWRAAAERWRDERWHVHLDLEFSE